MAENETSLRSGIRMIDQIIETVPFINLGDKYS